eukprot:Phypoly_transcript_20314.p1 GENE.Phypoly_transcript_20314~~Phypoly_transcript_20314.p1  ORF type:complete len:111 (+),score=6.28 Phypoly_transcript_20314:11-343(+)
MADATPTLRCHCAGLFVCLVLYPHTKLLARTNMSFGNFEVQILAFIKSLNDEKSSSGRIEENHLLAGMRDLIQCYIKEKLEDCSDIKYNDDLAKSLIAVQDFSDLLSIYT